MKTLCVILVNLSSVHWTWSKRKEKVDYYFMWTVFHLASTFYQCLAESQYYYYYLSLPLQPGNVFTSSFIFLFHSRFCRVLSLNMYACYVVATTILLLLFHVHICVWIESKSCRGFPPISKLCPLFWGFLDSTICLGNVLKINKGECRSRSTLSMKIIRRSSPGKCRDHIRNSVETFRKRSHTKSAFA